MHVSACYCMLAHYTEKPGKKSVENKKKAAKIKSAKLNSGKRRIFKSLPRGIYHCEFVIENFREKYVTLASNLKLRK